MTIEYYPDADMLTITLAKTPYRQEDVRDTEDPDVLLLYDAEGYLSEIEVSNASEHVHLDEMRRKLSFEEVRSAKAVS